MSVHPSGLESRLRLKRVFLRVMVTSLVTCAAVAVVVLLLGEFDELTARVIGTLGALAVHSGIAMACAAALERRRWPTLSRIGLALFGLNFVVLITCIWLPAGPDEAALRATLTTGALAGFYVLVIPAADMLERRLQPPVALAGLVVGALAFLMVLVCIWAERAESEVFAKATAIASIAAFSCAHTCLLLRVPGGAKLGWLRTSTLVSVWALALVAAAAITWELEDELVFRVLGALGVLDACGSLSLVIMVKLRQVQKVERLQTATARVELRCPRCTTLQTVDAGAAKCTACGLGFRIELDEPRCAKCDYLLWQLPERRCPECGTAF